MSGDDLTVGGPGVAERTILVHLNVGLAADDPRDADDVAEQIMRRLGAADGPGGGSEPEGIAPYLSVTFHDRSAGDFVVDCADAEEV